MSLWMSRFRSLGCWIRRHASDHGHCTQPHVWVLKRPAIETLASTTSCQSAEAFFLVIFVRALRIIVPLIIPYGIVVGIWQISAPFLQLSIFLLSLIHRPGPVAGLSTVVIAEVLLGFRRSLARFWVEYSTISHLCTLVCWSRCIVGIVAFFAHGAEIGVVAGTHVLSFRIAFEDKIRWGNRLRFDKISFRPPDVSNAELWIHASFMVLNTAEVVRVFECHVRNLEVTCLKQILQGSKVFCESETICFRYRNSNLPGPLCDYHRSLSNVCLVPGWFELELKVVGQYTVDPCASFWFVPCAFFGFYLTIFAEIDFECMLVGFK